MKLSEEKWKKKLSKEEFHILREKGTERPFSGKYNKNKRKGVYVCSGCGNKVFSSETKFDSKSGWPSFYKPLLKSVRNKKDKSFLMVRTEILCGKCGGHLGHVFDDGPEPTGKRYCINSIALKFKGKK
tara:strand:- start:237 stop:620 length:384 start_codon:yes stop_codon:yes gene_type:complete